MKKIKRDSLSLKFNVKKIKGEIKNSDFGVRGISKKTPKFINRAGTSFGVFGVGASAILLRCGMPKLAAIFGVGGILIKTIVHLFSYKNNDKNDKKDKKIIKTF